VAPGLLQYAMPNPQSLLFCFIKTIMAVPNRTEPDMISRTLHYMLPLLIESMDWVGFMEKYDKSLLVLQHVLPPNVTRQFQSETRLGKRESNKKC
jgi:hypothetical protein